MALAGISTVWDSVGNTPLLKLESLSQLTGCEILGKAEFMNPGGSIKDRAAKGMIERAEQLGLLKPGATLCEGTAGNTGIGLALLGRARGYHTVVVMPDNQVREKYDLLEAMGAEVIKVPVVPFSNPNHFFHTAKALAEQKGYFWPNQFENTANSDYHRDTTGREIWQQTEGRLDILVSSVGTSGTLSGVSRYLKEQNRNIQVVLADPEGSGMYAQVKRGVIEGAGSSFTEGIGIMRITENFKLARIDDAMQVSDQQALEMLYHLAKHDGLVIGTSAALNARAAYELGLKYKGSGKRIVTFLCDHGSRYTSKVFNPEYLASRKLEVRPL